MLRTIPTRWPTCRRCGSFWFFLTSQETSKLLSRRKRVAGKEIEVMCAARDLHTHGKTDAGRAQLDELYREDAILRQALREAETGH